MARTVDEIKAQIGLYYTNNTIIKALYGLDSSKTFEEQFSAVSLESIIFYNIANAIWTLENLFETHKTEVQEIIAMQKPHTLRWYAGLAKAFLYGVDLSDESDTYDTSLLTDEQITAAKVITHVAVIEVESELLIKIATTANNKLSPVPASQLSAFEYYMNRRKDAGVHLKITTGPADKLYLEIDAYVNPLVFGIDGKIDDKEPVRDAVKSYLKKLPFNGILALAYLIDELQKIDGVVIPHVVSAKAKYGLIETPFAVKYQPDAGYLEFENETDLKINYILQTAIL